MTRKYPIGYGIVQTAVMRMKGLSVGSKALYALLASYTGSKEYCFPSIKRIAEDLDVKEDTVYKYMKELKKNKLLIVSKLYPNTTRNNNKYEICYIEEDYDIKPLDEMPELLEDEKDNERYDLIKTYNTKTKITIKDDEGIEKWDNGHDALGGMNLCKMGRYEPPEKGEFINNNSINSNSINNNNNDDICHPLDTSFDKKENQDTGQILYKKIKESFEKEGGRFVDYAREGKAIKRIIKLANGDEGKIMKMIDAFHRLTKSADKFWGKQPFLPSILCSGGIWPRVEIECAGPKQAEDDLSWYDEIVAKLQGGGA